MKHRSITVISLCMYLLLLVSCTDEMEDPTAGSATTTHQTPSTTKEASQNDASEDFSRMTKDDGRSELANRSELRAWDIVLEEKIAGTFASKEDLKKLNDCLKSRDIAVEISAIFEGEFETVGDVSIDPHKTEIVLCLQATGLEEKLLPAMVPGVDALPHPDFVKRSNETVNRDLECLKKLGADIVPEKDEFGFLTYEFPEGFTVEDLEQCD